MSGALVSLRGISRRLGGNAVLKGIDLDVPDGQVLAIMGPSGGGKSTCFAASTCWSGRMRAPSRSTAWN
jgi:ABC-type transporter Mla maintaining outer membrane lipid asymmetry ATPase subunit MlaF